MPRGNRASDIDAEMPTSLLLQNESMLCVIDRPSPELAQKALPEQQRAFAGPALPMASPPNMAALLKAASGNELGAAFLFRRGRLRTAAQTIRP
jgi:hypothetical protein